MSSVYADYQGDRLGRRRSACCRRLLEDAGRAGRDHLRRPSEQARRRVAIARRWFDTENVDVIMDLPNSAVALAVVAVAEEKNKAVIGSGAGSSVMTGPKCSRNFVHWTYDTYSSGAGLGRAGHRTAERPGSSSPPTTPSARTWRRIAPRRSRPRAARCWAPCAIRSIRRTSRRFCCRRRVSGADVIAFANGGGDTNGCFKQAHEFALAPKGGLAGFTLNITNVPALGLDVVQGALLSTAFYWDANDATARLWQAFLAAHPKKMMPNDMHAGMYAATEHLMKAMAADEERRGRRQARRRDEDDPDRRPAVRQGNHSRGRPRSASGLSLSGKDEPSEVEIRLGLFRARLDDPARRRRFGR